MVRPRLLLLLLWIICLSTTTQVSGQDSPLFTEVAQEVGLNFTHFNGMTGEWTLPEIMGSGAALFDYDNDGDLDAFLVQGALLGQGKKPTDAIFPWKDAAPPIGRLYRNDGTVRAEGTRAEGTRAEGTRQLRFTDVTEPSKLTARGYGMGVATGDVNNDGWVDLLVTNFGQNQLWRNNRDGTFREETATLPTVPPSWSVSVAFLDYDRDGWLDLYVANYVNFSLEKHPTCYAKSSARDYCGPDAFSPVPDQLFHNRGDGSFEDVSEKAGITTETWAGLGVVTADFNADGWPDIYVANDGDPNFLWINQKNGTFKNEALWAGCAVNRMGMPEASMGVDAGDFDGDGDEDLVMTHLMDETNTFYTNLGNGLFTDRTIQIGFTATTGRYTGFGARWIDYDNDGWLDLLIVNGAVRTLPDLARQGDRYPLRQPKQLLRGHEGQRLVDVSAQAGPAFALPEVSRGAAFGDVDNDGDTDVLVLNSNGPARLLLNQVGARHHWLGLRLVGTRGQRDMLGARVEVVREGRPSLWRRVQTDGSYASANDARILVGLGAETRVKAVRVHWPDGRVESWSEIAIDRYTTLRQGTAQ
jgi:hypothetical protein